MQYGILTAMAEGFGAAHTFQARKRRNNSMQTGVSIAEFELPDGRMSVSRNGGLVPPSAGDGLPALMRQTGKEVF